MTGALRWTAIVAALCACAPEAPHILLTIDARTTVREVTELRVAIVDEQGEQSEIQPAVADRQLPKTLTIATAGRRGELTIRVEAFDADGTTTGLGELRAPFDAGAATLVLDPTEFTVNELVKNDQTLGEHYGRQVAVAPDGSFMIVWLSEDIAGPIRARLFGPDGRPRDNAIMSSDIELAVTEQGDFLPEFPAVTHGPAGYFVTWELRDASFDYAVHGRIFSTEDAATRSSGPLVVASTDGINDRLATVVADGDGYVALWQETAESQFPVSFGRNFATALDGAGEPVDGERIVELGTGAELGPADAVRLTTGAVATVWTDYGGADGLQLRARVVDPDAIDAGSAEHAVSPPDHTFPEQPRVAALRDGGFAVAWIVFGERLYVRLFSADGTPRGPPTAVADLPNAIEAAADVAASADGTVAVVWSDPAGIDTDAEIYVRYLAADGMPLGAARRISAQLEGAQLLPSIAARPDGSFVAAWTDASGAGADTSGTGVTARILYPETSPRDRALGAICDAADDCDDGLACAKIGRCLATCVAATALCPTGGVCEGEICHFDR